MPWPVFQHSGHYEGESTILLLQQIKADFHMDRANQRCSECYQNNKWGSCTKFCEKKILKSRNLPIFGINNGGPVPLSAYSTATLVQIVANIDTLQTWTGVLTPSPYRETDIYLRFGTYRQLSALNKTRAWKFLNMPPIRF